jgi:hypothetical protein
VIVPVRDEEVELAATEYLTSPLPLPGVPLVMVIQPSAVVAVHVQPSSVVTATEPVPPAASIVAALRESVYEHTTDSDVPNWRTTTVTPPTITVPSR